jgi:hypothetical protein
VGTSTADASVDAADPWLASPSLRTASNALDALALSIARDLQHKQQRAHFLPAVCFDLRQFAVHLRTREFYPIEALVMTAIWAPCDFTHTLRTPLFDGIPLDTIAVCLRGLACGTESLFARNGAVFTHFVECCWNRKHASRLGNAERHYTLDELRAYRSIGTVPSAALVYAAFLAARDTYVYWRTLGGTWNAAAGVVQHARVRFDDDLFLNLAPTFERKKAVLARCATAAATATCFLSGAASQRQPHIEFAAHEPP